LSVVKGKIQGLGGGHAHGWYLELTGKEGSKIQINDFRKGT
jgi:hypothetical protein